jgi:hypothetical protein
VTLFTRKLRSRARAAAAKSTRCQDFEFWFWDLAEILKKILFLKQIVFF